MDVNGRTVARALALYCIVMSGASANGRGACSAELTREDAIHLLAEGYVRAMNNLPVQASVERKAVEEARRGISAQVEKGWLLQIKQEKDCTYTIIYKNPKRSGSGLSVFADEKKRLVDIFQHR